MAKKKRQKAGSAENGVQLPKAGAVVATSRPKKPKVQELWENYFGEGTLSDWQRLCGDLALPDDLPSKRQCRIVSNPAAAQPTHPPPPSPFRFLGSL